MSYKKLFMLFLVLLTASRLTGQMTSSDVGGINILIPSPISTLQEIGSENYSKLDLLVPSSNRLIAAFLEESAKQKVVNGDSYDLYTYSLVEVSRDLENTDYTEQAFNETRDQLKSTFGDILNSSFKQVQDEIDQKLKKLDMQSIKIGETRQLGILFSKSNAFSFGLIMAVQSGNETRYVVLGGILLQLKHRLVYAYLFTRYTNEESIKWIGTSCEAWADALLNANK